KKVIFTFYNNIRRQRLAIYIYILNNKNLFLITKLFYIKLFIIIKNYNNLYIRKYSY
ncbi:hypothetical protein CORC01_04100, partial [Colletotrichum orchidophilum]